MYIVRYYHHSLKKLKHTNEHFTYKESRYLPCKKELSKKNMNHITLQAELQL